MASPARDRYDRYIASPAWLSKREEAFRHYGRACLACGDPATDVHHRTYDRLGAEAMTDLRVLCEMCHLTIHTLLKGRGWGWLAKITDDVVNGLHLTTAYGKPAARRRSSKGLPGAIPIPKGKPRDKPTKPPRPTPAQMLEPNEHGFVPKHLRGAVVKNGRVSAARTPRSTR